MRVYIHGAKTKQQRDVYRKLYTGHELIFVPDSNKIIGKKPTCIIVDDLHDHPKQPNHLPDPVGETE